MSRRTLIVANFKQHHTVAQVLAWVTSVGPIEQDANVEVVVAPSATALWAAARALEKAPNSLSLAAQNLFYEDAGAYTGELGGPQLKEAGASWVLVGHSERRQYFQETDATTGKRIEAAHRAGLQAIVCLGENAQERAQGRSLAVLRAQLSAATASLSQHVLGQLTLAYEPVWAIGTGDAASPADVQEASAALRAAVAERDADAGASMRIVYGGSVKAAEVRRLLSLPDVDGLLVGKASLDAASFQDILQAAQS